MIAVLFEVRVADAARGEYLDIAASLKRELEKIDGFISVKRFQSLGEPHKLLSLSFFRDEEAVAAWRRKSCHRAAQARGRGGLFDDYRLRIAEVVRDYGLKAREQAPIDSRRSHG